MLHVYVYASWSMSTDSVATETEIIMMQHNWRIKCSIFLKHGTKL